MSITQYNKPTCTKNNGGVVKLWLTVVTNITSVTHADNEVSAITMKSDTYFQPIYFKQGTAQPTVERADGINTAKIVFDAEKLTAESRKLWEELSDYANCGFAAIYKNPQGKYVLLGWDETFETERPLKFMVGNYDGKIDINEPESMIIELEQMGGTTEFPLLVESSVIDDIDATTTTSTTTGA